MGTSAIDGTLTASKLGRVMAVGFALTRSTKHPSLAEFDSDGASRREAPAPTSPNL